MNSTKDNLKELNKVRHAARDLAINILYQLSTSEVSTEDAIYDTIDNVRNIVETNSDDNEYACSAELLKSNIGLFDDMEMYTKLLVYGVKDIKYEVDDLISGFDKKWTSDRVQPVLKSVLGVAMYEMNYIDDVPIKVAINEAIDFARLYAGEEPIKFLNAILQEYMDSLEIEDVNARTIPKSQLTSKILPKGIAVPKSAPKPNKSKASKKIQSFDDDDF